MWCGDQPQEAFGKKNPFIIVSSLLPLCASLVRHSGGFWHERDRDRERERERDRDRDRDRDRWSPRRRSRSPHFRDRRRSRSNSPPHRSPRRRVTPPLTAEERERQRKGIPPTRDKCCTGEIAVIFITVLIWHGNIICCLSSVHHYYMDGPSCKDSEAGADHGSI